MFTKEYDSFLQNVQHALDQPIRTRCTELTALLERSSLLELHNFYPILIDNIFGVQGTKSWGLRTVTDNYGEDFKHLHHFLSPCGPLFHLIYTLLKDPNIKYEFSLVYLPRKIKDYFDSSNGNPFYTELVNVNPQTKHITSLLLNPFDYYFFHFAFHLINPWQQRTGSTVTSWNTVYYSLCCDYILYFLPTDPAAKILPEIYYNGKNPLKHSPSKNAQSSPRLLNSIPYPKMQDEKSNLNLHSHHPRNEIWRSETLLTVLTDIWLYNDLVHQSVSTSEAHETFNSIPKRLHYNELPTGEYMRIVRVLVKQLHAFSDSAKCDDTHLCELKKIAIPMIQGKMYLFLRNLIHRWPLDGSFRLVLELWLTYIQPWRYLANNLIKQMVKTDHNPDADDVALNNEKQHLHPQRNHLPFIAENLLCYVVLFEQLLPRFCRADLVSPKISLMLYRIAKVFDQSNLPNFLREVENCVESRQPSPSHKSFLAWNSPDNNWSKNVEFSHINPMSNFSSNLPALNTAASCIDKNWSTIVRQKIYELEDRHFRYKPLFANNALSQEVIELMLQIKRSIGPAQDLIRQKEQEEKEMYSGFWGSIKYFLQAPLPINDEFTLNDRRKVPIYLEVALNNLKDMFGVNDDMLQDDLQEHAATLNNSNNSGLEMSNDFRFLTPEKVRNRLNNLKYDGDPDLLPIRTDEFAFLVRFFYQCSCRINEYFKPTFYHLYHNPSYCGRFSRQILLPPITIYKYDKSILGSPRIAEHLPPRISLRYFASFQFVFYLILGGFLSWLCGYRIEYFLFVLFLIFLCFKMLKALRRDNSSIRHEYPTQGFGNISFNDSF